MKAYYIKLYIFKKNTKNIPHRKYQKKPFKKHLLIYFKTNYQEHALKLHKQ